MHTTPRRRNLFKPQLGSFGAAAVFACALVACSGDDGNIRIQGDVAGLDTIALRGDSLLNAPSRERLILDSLRTVVDARMRAVMDSGSVAGTIDPSFPTAEKAGMSITARARARGDSMARADARALLAPIDPSKRVKADTVRGVLTVVGTSTVPQVVLLADDGNKQIALSGMATTGLSKLAGAEVVVRGFLVSPRDVVVSDFIVRAVNKIPAYDGVLDQVDGAWTLVLTDGSGRKRLPVVPATLRSYPGLRVWVSFRPGSDTPDSYGLVRR